MVEGAWPFLIIKIGSPFSPMFDHGFWFKTVEENFYPGELIFIENQIIITKSNGLSFTYVLLKLKRKLTGRYSIPKSFIIFKKCTLMFVYAFGNYVGTF